MRGPKGTKVYDKYMIAFDPKISARLNRDAKVRGINLQQFLRSVVVPRFYQLENDREMVPIRIDKLLHLVEHYPLNGERPLNGKHTRKAKAVTDSKRHE